MEKDVTIIIVTWNSMKYLGDFLKSLENQTFKNFELIAIDNNSSDGAAEYLVNSKIACRLVRNSGNQGFSKANNVGIKMSKTPYVLISNTDIILQPNFLEELLKTAKIKSAASICGKLLKYDPVLNHNENSVTIDSTGIVFFKNRRAIDRGEMEKDQGQYDQTREVFGVGGACSLFKKSALEDVSVNGEYYDEDFFAYKEDLDLAWRLRSAGYCSYYEPKAVAFHRRAISRKTDLSDKGALINRKTKSDFANFLSFRNHLYLLLKNEYRVNYLLYPSILWYEFKKIIYLSLKERRTLKGLADFAKNYRLMAEKKKIIDKKRKLSKQEMDDWFIKNK